MSRKERLLVNAIDVEQEYKVIGLDLAKNDTSCVCIAESGEIIAIDRLSYANLLETAEQLSPTIFAMEPCNGMHWLVNQLQDYGHICRVISGGAVQQYVESHFGKQKTDLNDAHAIAYLALDEMLHFIRAKTPSEMSIQALQAIRTQLSKQKTASIVCFKSMCQGYGISISKGKSSVAAFIALLKETDKIPEEVKEALRMLITNYRVLRMRISKIDKVLEKIVISHPTGKNLKDIPSFGVQCAARLLTIAPNIKDFKGPKDLVAYCGLVPRNITTGHIQKTAGITKRGDKLMRRNVIQAANVLYRMNKNDSLQNCKLKRWMDKKLKVLPYQTFIVQLAAKLLRIAYAVMKYDTSFDYARAGVARSALKS